MLMNPMISDEKMGIYYAEMNDPAYYFGGRLNARSALAALKTHNKLIMSHKMLVSGVAVKDLIVFSNTRFVDFSKVTFPCLENPQIVGWLNVDFDSNIFPLLIVDNEHYLKPNRADMNPVDMFLEPIERWDTNALVNT